MFEYLFNNSWPPNTPDFNIIMDATAVDPKEPCGHTTGHNITTITGAKTSIHLKYDRGS